MPETAGTAVLGLDYGTKKVGVALLHEQLGVARPLAVVPVADSDLLWRELDTLVAAWRPRRLVVGLPLAATGGETPMARAARRFATALKARYPLAVELHDERLTTREAAGTLAAARRAGLLTRSAARRRDAAAAAAMLDSWQHEARCRVVFRENP